MSTKQLGAVTTKEEAIQVAREDAERVFRDLDPYRFEAQVEQGNWHVELQLKNPEAQGGGASYVISSVDGHIISKKYYQ